jgi:hypothetical protein
VLLRKYYSGDQIKKIKVGRVFSTYGERRGAYRVLVGKTERMILLGSPSRR